jgi:putative ubiquitin-RnfH superfamily antitoxin RatB of RatAB toxin-antitoxin module
MDRAEPLRVEVVYCPQPGRIDCVALNLAPGATVASALQASGHLERHGLAAEGLRLGVWCRSCGPDQLLRDRDRVEIYRALVVDPKEARRQRYQRHRERQRGR